MRCALLLALLLLGAICLATMLVAIMYRAHLAYIMALIRGVAKGMQHGGDMYPTCMKEIIRLLTKLYHMKLVIDPVSSLLYRTRPVLFVAAHPDLGKSILCGPDILLPALLGTPFRIVAFQFPSMNPRQIILKSSNFIAVNRRASNGYETMKNELEACHRDGISVFLYAEGANGIKYKSAISDPYKLAPFKTGVLNVAFDLKMSICPIVFDPQFDATFSRSVEMHVLAPVHSFDFESSSQMIDILRTRMEERIRTIVDS